MSRTLSANRLIWVVFVALFLFVDLPLFADEKVINLKGNQLEVQVGAAAEVWIDTEDRKDVRLYMLGDVDSFDTIRADTQGGKVVVEDIAVLSKSSNSISSNVRVNGNVVVYGGEVSIGTITVPGVQEQTARLSKVRITVPKLMPITLRSIGANVMVGTVDASFKLELLGHGNIQIAKLRDGDIKVQGTGNVQVGNVTGDLKVRSTGTGDFVVQEGQIDKLSISLRGTGNVTINSDVVDAAIRLTGTGNVKIRSVQHPVIRRHSGVGSLKIGNDG